MHIDIDYVIARLEHIRQDIDMGEIGRDQDYFQAARLIVNEIQAYLRSQKPVPQEAVTTALAN